MNNKKDVKALILSGGGVRGTFQYGAIDHIYNHVLDEDEGFKIVCGVSAGAMNGSIIVQDKFEEGRKLWMEQIENGVPAFKMRYSFFTLLLYSILPGIFLLNKLKKVESIFVNENLRIILNEKCKELVKTLEDNDDYLRLGIVEYQSGKYISIDPRKLKEQDNVVDFIIASTAIPLAFPAVNLNTSQCFDGGVINITPFSDIFDIISKPEFHQKYNLTTIYSVLCSPLSTNESSLSYEGLINIGERTLDLLLSEIYKNDKEIFDRTNAYVLLREELEKVIPDQEKLKRIYDKIDDETGIDIRKYVSSHCEVIAPEPEEWKKFIESNFFPESLERPGLGNCDSVKLFWKQWPSTLTKDRKKLLMCYHFGMYMADKVVGSKR